jgi:hypothetical protein
VKPALEVEDRYRSRLEERVADQLTRERIGFDYESRTIPYVVPARQAKYLLDFAIRARPILLEVKGWFRTAAERQKLIHIRTSNPGIDIRLVFQNANKPIYKGSKTSYAKWATDNGFKWCDKGTVPDAWIEEMRDE